MPAPMQPGNNNVSPSQRELPYGGSTTLPPGTTLAPRVNPTTGEMICDTTTTVSSDDSGKSQDTMYSGKSDIPKPPNRIMEGTHPQQQTYEIVDS